jgi:hypothetical protein
VLLSFIFKDWKTEVRLMEVLLDTLKVIAHSMNAGFVYLGLVLAYVLAVKFKLGRPAFLFVWGCSVPLSLYCFFFWVYKVGGDQWALFTLALDTLAFAQLGWLGGAIALLGALVKKELMSKVGLWVSWVSVVLHGGFLGAVTFLWDGS